MHLVLALYVWDYNTKNAKSKQTCACSRRESTHESFEPSTNSWTFVIKYAVVAAILCILHAIHPTFMEDKPAHPSDRRPNPSQRRPCATNFLPGAALAGTLKEFTSTDFLPCRNNFPVLSIKQPIQARQTSSPSEPSCSKSRRSLNKAPSARSPQAS